jgi:starch synthase/alpha-amylase
MLADLCSALIGSLPIVYDTGGSRDAVSRLDAAADRGNGFVFRYFDVEGLLWAVGRAIDFSRRFTAARTRQVRRVMTESRVGCDPGDTADRYIDLYERMLQRPMGHLRSSSREFEERLAQTAA